MVIAMSGVQLKDKKRSTDVLFMWGLWETMVQFAMTNSVRWYGIVLRREDGHVLRRSSDVEFDCQSKKGRPKRTWKKMVDEESMKDSL